MINGLKGNTDMPPQSLDRPLKKLPVAIILPAVLSVVLFFLTIFLLVLPTLESALMSQRRELVHELTETAWSTIRQYHQMQSRGQLSEAEAQERAVAHLRQMRYGPELKDYFWINDMRPSIVMHPYRQDLEGKDVSDFADPTGKRLFVECVRVVREKREGFVDYQWQWKDDPNRIVPKISYVKGFLPWNWVVGTGIYIDDIQKEISSITKQLTLVCLGILVLVFILSAFIIWQGIKVENKRKRSEDIARMQQEQLYQAGKLATVGTLAAGVAHEINNPVTAILLNAPALRTLWQQMEEISESADRKENVPDLHHRAPKLLDHIEDCAVRIRNIVNELKDFSRLSPPELNDEVCINSAVEKAAALTGNMIKKSTDHFSTALTDGLPRFRGNKQKVEQVIVNLLVNACQAAGDNKPRITVSTSYDENAHIISASVEDTGVGIPDEVMKRVKDPFFTTKQSSGSMGLGLAISDRIMKDHGGTLNFTAGPSEGTMAVISFPVN